MAGNSLQKPSSPRRLSACLFDSLERRQLFSVVYTAQQVNTATGPTFVASKDVNGDGRPDIVTANSTANKVSIILNTGDGTFAAATNYTVGNGPQSLAFADFNSDGKLDIITANEFANTVSLLPGTGSG
ncbi:MAG TPA: VCBS repeat-containing protein, partial [Tepidisphaeraceae bacterium]